jgi:hypothetical protein
MHSQSPDKLKQILSACQKADGIVFWDRKGLMIMDFMQQGTTVMSKKVLQNTKKLHKTIQNKGHGLLTSAVVILHDSVHSHTAACTQALLNRFNWKLFDHHPYSPDLAPGDCHVFTYLKNWLLALSTRMRSRWKLSKHG